MKKKKIIFISPPGFFIKRKQGQNDQNPDHDHFYFGRRGLGHFIASNFKKVFNDIEIEIWRIDSNVDDLKSRVIKEGILSKVYPLKGNKKYNYSINFINDLKKEAIFNEVIIWFDGLHNFFFMVVSLLFKKQYQIVHRLGGDNFTYKFEKTGKLKYKIFDFIEKQLFNRNINFGILAIEREYENFTNYDTKLLKSHVAGIDTKRWKLIDQKTAREKLGLPLNEKIVLQSGRANSNKGTHIAIKLWKNFLERENIKLYLTGVTEYDELYDEVKSSGCNFTGTIDHEILPYWMAAADIYLYIPDDEITLNFAAIGYSPLEALATGTPIVCTIKNDIEFMGIKIEEYSDVIKTPVSIENAADMVIGLLDKKPNPKRCNEFIQNHLSDEVVFNNIISELSKDNNIFFSSLTRHN
mgnify:CR=1 FL=1